MAAFSGKLRWLGCCEQGKALIDSPTIFVAELFSVRVVVVKPALSESNTAADIFGRLLADQERNEKLNLAPDVEREVA